MSQILQRATLQLLRAYKWAISPMFAPACRYVPTCSEYAMEAVERYGALRGGLMAVARLLRCHPFAHGGYDPVVKQAPFAKRDPFVKCDPVVKYPVARHDLVVKHDPVVTQGWGAPWKSGPLRAASDVQNSPGFSPSGRP